GENCLIYAGVRILDNCIIGNNCILQPGAIIGSDGFGFAPIQDGKYYKIPQTGNVILEDDVEIGANATIDRATMGSTIIRQGTKIDNLIQIGHNCEIGSNTVIAGQTGISGSTKVGNNCMIGGQTGVAGHLKIGNNVKIAAKSGIMIDIPDGDFQMGGPSFNAREYKKSYIHFMNLDKLAKRINQLEKALKDIRK
nr:UDP-3-O-(3-hydroxymyristoyl)glucosamine N-acyltransferase [Bacteroidales bacterium]